MSNEMVFHPELLRIASEGMKRSLLSNVLLSLLFLGLFYSKIPLLYLAIWAVLFYLLLALRLHFSNKLNSTKEKEPAYNKLTYVTLLNALMWVVSLILTIEYGEPNDEYFMIIILFGLSAGTLSVLSALPKIFYAYNLFLLVPLFITFLFYYQDTQHIMVALMLILFGYVLISTSKTLFNSLVSTIRNKQQADTKMQEAQQANKKINELDEQTQHKAQIQNHYIELINELARSKAAGKLDGRVPYHEEFAEYNELSNNLNLIFETLEQVVSHSSTIFKNIAQGDLNQHFNSEVHGDYLVLKDSLNSMSQELQALISESNQTLHAIKSGNLNSIIDRDFNGDFNQLKESINALATSLNEIITKVDSSVKTLEYNIEETSKVSSHVSANMKLQGDYINSNTEHITQMQSIFKKSNHQINEAVNTAQVISQKAKEGVEEVRSSVDSIRHIQDKISMIEEISEQTNLLALNASIEAARAGEHGKGFAVVAIEVRKLADLTKQMASQIKEVTLQGTQSSEEAMAEFQQILPQIKLNEEHLNAIKSQHLSQAQSVEAIFSSFSDIQRVCDENSSTINNLDTMSSQLEKKVEELTQIVNYFTKQSR
jgi:methyl-accepting chemotaxis protein